MRFLSVIGDPPSAAWPHYTQRRGERVCDRFHQSDAVATIAAVTTTAARPFAPRLWLEALYTIPRVDLAQVDPITPRLLLSPPPRRHRRPPRPPRRRLRRPAPLPHRPRPRSGPRRLEPRERLLGLPPRHG